MALTVPTPFRQHAKIVFWKLSPFAMTQIVLQIYPYTCMAFKCSQINAIFKQISS